MGSEIISFDIGKKVCGRWKVISRLGAGGYGSVYKVEDLTRKGVMAALKVEKTIPGEEGVLKIEAGVLNKLKEQNSVIRLLFSGKRPAYDFIVITLCGSNMIMLKRNSPEGFSESTVIRITLQVLFSMKQLHEIGYIHRDVKPGNVMNGVNGRDQRTFFLIDYGMARSFIRECSSGKTELRKQRKKVLLRGTLRYCSSSMHKRQDQGRVDDLWSMLYMMVELYNGLPWNTTKDEQIIKKMKETIKDEDLFKELPKEFVQLAQYLRSLNYESRPDYFKMYELLIGRMKKDDYSFDDPYDWEKEKATSDADLETAYCYSQRELKTKKPLEPFELQFVHYPSMHPSKFKQKILNL